MPPDQQRQTFRAAQVWQKHMYANQNTVTKLRQPDTLEILEGKFTWAQ
ncbi:MAG: hypothetical protein ACI8Y4_005165 [Candidatus Poriferisodalaceae bacterium]|jgi:hypothetical protein